MLAKNSPSNGGIPLNSLRLGSYLYFLGTRNARMCAWVGLFFSCGFGGLLIIPLIFTGALRDAERRGSLAAICDFFLGTCEVDVNTLPLPPELRPKPELEPPSHISQADDVAGMMQRKAHGILEKDKVKPGP